MFIQNAGTIAHFQQRARFAANSEHNSPGNAISNAPLDLPGIGSVQVAERAPTTVELKNAVDSINKFLQQSNRSIQFSVDTDTQKVVVKLIDSNTGAEIRQYPSKEVLAISKSIENMQLGLLLKQQA